RLASHHDVGSQEGNDDEIASQLARVPDLAVLRFKTLTSLRVAIDLSQPSPTAFFKLIAHRCVSCSLRTSEEGAPAGTPSSLLLVVSVAPDGHPAGRVEQTVQRLRPRRQGVEVPLQRLRKSLKEPPRRLALPKFGMPGDAPLRQHLWDARDRNDPCVE